MIQGTWTSTCIGPDPNAPRSRFEQLVIHGDDVAGLPISPIYPLKGIHPLSKFRFLVGGKNLLPTIKQFHLIFDHDIRPALWAVEIGISISNPPKYVHVALQKGNYNVLNKLTGVFNFVSNEVDYYVQLGCWIVYFHSMEGKFFSKELMTIAVHNFNDMVFVSDAILPESIGKALLDLQAIERGEIATWLSLASLKIIRKTIEEQKSLSDIGTGVLELFSGFHPPQITTRLGLIRDTQLNTRFQSNS
jgi:hypothetical protein